MQSVKNIVLLFLLLHLPVLAEPLNEKQINERIEANQAADLSEEALRLWQDALLALEAAKQARKAEQKARSELENLAEDPRYVSPELPSDDANLGGRVSE